MAGMETEEYIAMNLDVIETGLMDLIDVELSKGDEYDEDSCGGSPPRRDENYSFPPQHHLDAIEGDNCDRLCQMQHLGADIANMP